MPQIFSEFDRYLFAEGRHCELYKFLGAHLTEKDGQKGVSFAVWAPEAKEVVVTGDFDAWQGQFYKMKNIGNGIWQIFVAEAQVGMSYKYKIHTQRGDSFLKADPVAFGAELRPNTASVITELRGFAWEDEKWQIKKKVNSQEMPLNIYELHLGSWHHNEQGEFLTYRELAKILPKYVKKLGYTHLEILPLMEHPLDNSWGYQVTGYYAPTSRYGSAQDLMHLINKCHELEIGVIMDWVPAHFCKDDHGLRMFDGTFCYEPAEELRRDNYGWGTSYFDLTKPEVRSFLISNACYWLEVFHIDGLRVDAVASMLYFDYGKEAGTWLPNEKGGRENFAAREFLRDLNMLVFARNPAALMMAEESTTYPLVTWPVHNGGLGFNYKWNMGWMNDVLEYVEKPTAERRWHHKNLTFSFLYAFSENFVLPFSHDEVVHGKKSLLNKMPGDYWQKFANLRLLIGYLMAHPGKKLLFMGQEFGQFIEWDEKRQLDWFLLDYDMHAKLLKYVKNLNKLYLEVAAFWQRDNNWSGFCWLEANDSEHSILSFLRFDKAGNHILVVCNFTEIAQDGYRAGVPSLGAYKEILNSDAKAFGGTGNWKRKVAVANPIPWQGQPNSLVLRLPPLAVLYLRMD